MSIYRLLVAVAGKVPLRTVLIVPFVLQIVGTVGLVGYLSWRNGQQAVNDVASQLRREISDRVQLYLKSYVATPHLINRINVDAVRVGQLDVQDDAKVERHLILQLQQFHSVTGILFGSNRGKFLSSSRHTPPNLILVSDRLDTSKIYVYRTDSLGNRGKLERSFRQPDARQRPWYKVGASSLKPTWTPIFPLGDRTGFSLNANLPIYRQDNNELLGVFSSALNLRSIGNFLNSLRVGKSGKIFILERNGLLIATSTPEKPYIVTPQKELKRLTGIDINNTLIRATSQYLTEDFGNEFNLIKNPKQLDFKINDQRQFVQVVPFRDEFGLDWLIVVVVPESDFMEQINASTYMTIWLCVGALIVATGIGILTTRWITKPILQLNNAAKKIAKGEWNKTVEIKRSDEVGQLAESFNQMAAQLQESFAAVRESESRLTQFLEAVPVGVTVHDATGKPTYANQTAKQIMGIDTLPDTRTAQLVEDYHLYLSGTEQRYPIERLPVVKALSGESSTVDDIDLHRRDQPLAGAGGNRIVPLQVWATPIFDETGQIVYAIVAFVDITQRHQAQKILADYNRTLESQVAQRTAALQKSEDTLKTAQRVAHVGSWEFDVITQKITWSEEQFRIFGLDPNQPEPNYEQHIQQIHPDDRASVQQSHAQLIATGKADELDFRILRPTGEVRYVSGRGETVVNEQGQVIKFFGTTMDITERKCAEAALLESEERFRTSVENMLDCFGIYNAMRDESGQIIDFRIEYVNAAVCVVNEMTKEQQIGKSLCELLPNHQSSGLFAEYVNVVETGNPLIKEALIYEDVYNQQRLTRAFDIRAAKLGDGFTAAWRDVTEKKRAEEELLQREQEFRALVEHAPDVITRVDRDYRFRYVNPRLEVETGIPAQEWIGKTELEMGIPEAIVNPWHEVLKRIFETGQEEFYESEFPSLGGMKYWLVRMVPEFAEDGSVQTVLNASRDITDKKRAELALQQSEERFREIAGTVSQFFFVRSASTGQYLYVSPAYETIWGRTCDSLYQNPESWIEAVHPDDRNLVQFSLTQQFQGNSVKREYRIIHPDGQERWIAADISVVRDETGQPQRFVGLVEDITPRKQIEKQLQLQSAAMAVATDGIAIINPNGEWRICLFKRGSHQNLWLRQRR